MADGTEIQGLLRRADGRWKISSTGQTFVEPDEKLAVARFLALTRPAEASVPIAPTVNADSLDSLAPTLKALDPLHVEVDAQGRITFRRPVPEAAIWAWVRQQILTRPKYVATMTGIEQIGWLNDLRKPADSPRLTELGTLYATKPRLSANERCRSKRFWREFCGAAQVETAADVDRDAVGRYETWLDTQQLSPKSVKHRIAKVRTVFAYGLKRGYDTRAALDACQMLEAPTAVSLDPRPISPDDFWAIHAAATKAHDDQFGTMMLLALNLCLYPSEVAVVRRSDIDLDRGEFVARRNKTKVPRVGVLWPETKTAMRKLPQRDSGYLFHSEKVLFNSNLIGKSWREYRDAAGVDEDVTFAGIRDAAFTIACRDSTLDAARMLAGHRAGQADHYVMRRPNFVADACAAIRRQFYTRAGRRASQPA